MIPFQKPLITGRELKYIEDLLKDPNNFFKRKYNFLCEGWFKEKYGAEDMFMTKSCTQALELAALILDPDPGDEVILPSYTYISTANPFVARGAVPVFVDIHPETMNINEKLIEDAITEKTKAIVPVHYAGVGCNMDEIIAIAKKHNLMVIEDGATSIFAKYKGQYLGTIGNVGCVSFDHIKNISSGQGGLLMLNSGERKNQADIYYNNGTNRTDFDEGRVSFFEWKSLGSKFFLSDLNAAYLFAQLEMAEEVTANRLASWKRYMEGLLPLKEKGIIELPQIPDYCEHNAHLFYFKVRGIEERSRLMKFLKEKEIATAFHYIPLHTSSFGKRVGRFHGEDKFTTQESDRILRLPLFYGLRPEEVDYILEQLFIFYKEEA